MVAVHSLCRVENCTHAVEFFYDDRAQQVADIWQHAAMQTTDVLIIGAGMAGASLACFLAPHRRVTVLEREAQPGYHATGRSAAMFSETYGNATVRALSTGSKAFYFDPPQGFSPVPLVSPRGALIVGGEADRDALYATWQTMQALVLNVAWWTPSQIRQRVPVLLDEHARCGIFEPDAMDMDVHAIHHGFLRAAKAAGAQMLCNAEVIRIERNRGGWDVFTRAGDFFSPVVVNAAGAWCDVLARMAGVAPVGLMPLRRTAFTTAPPEGLDIRQWPLVIDAGERFYFKPDAGMLLMSSANEDPSLPQDVQPEELDVAIAVDRIEAATTLRVRRVHRQWAGLRSFVADKSPVVGFDPQAPGFFWLAAQGGYGIQTAPALGELAAAWVQGLPVPPALAQLGVDAPQLSPSRVGLGSGVAT